MGNYISNNTVLLAAKRVLSKYNIESRVFKEIEKQSTKPVVAPKHEAGVIDYHKSLKGMYIIVQALEIYVLFNRHINCFVMRFNFRKSRIFIQDNHCKQRFR